MAALVPANSLLLKVLFFLHFYSTCSFLLCLNFQNIKTLKSQKYPPKLFFFILLTLFFFSFFFYYSYVHTRLGLFLPPDPTPSLITHSTPSRSPPQYPAETILPLSLILL
jgi:hypothetical protein